MRARTFQVVSFGCKVNQAEGESLAARLRARGLEQAAAGAPPDVVVVNTCAVTGEAARQARQSVRRAIRGGAAVVVTGCAAHPAAQDAALRAIPEVLFLEPDKDRVAERLTERGTRNPELGAQGREAVALPAVVGSELRVPGSAFSSRARALLKIQDGCPASCAYCIVPKVRPAVWSLAPDEAARRVGQLLAAGYREVVLCGIRLGLYGVLNAECGEVRNEQEQTPRLAAALARRVCPGGLVELLDRLVALPGRWRLRLSSIEPMEVSDALLARLAARPDRLCPHLHVPLQSGSDAVLRRMGRPYSSAEFLAKVGRIREVLPQPAVTTDVLVGFPGETDEDHRATLRVCREAAFSRIHVFPFSKRPGTRAAAMKPEVPRDVIRARRRAVAALGEELAARFRESLIGGTAEVVLERLLPGGEAEGTSERYVRVRVTGLTPAAARRDLVAVRLARTAGGRLEGEAAPG